MISKDDIEHLKNLARVEFDEKETETLAKDLNSILGYMEILKEADISEVPEMTHAVEDKNVMRPDETKDALASSRDDVVGAFPESTNEYLKVKAIL